jgi:hypothetical protein
MIDALKPIFGFNFMDTRRVRMNAKLRRIYPAVPAWVLPDGNNNFEAVQSTMEGGTVYMVFRDYSNGSRCTTLTHLEGNFRKGVWMRVCLCM